MAGRLDRADAAAAGAGGDRKAARARGERPGSLLRVYSHRAVLLFMRLRTIPALDRSAASTDLPPHGGDTPRPAL